MRVELPGEEWGRGSVSPVIAAYYSVGDIYRGLGKIDGMIDRRPGPEGRGWPRTCIGKAATACRQAAEQDGELLGHLIEVDGDEVTLLEVQGGERRPAGFAMQRLPPAGSLEHRLSNKSAGVSACGVCGVSGVGSLICERTAFTLVTCSSISTASSKPKVWSGGVGMVCASGTMALSLVWSRASGSAGEPLAAWPRSPWNVWRAVSGSEIAQWGNMVTTLGAEIWCFSQ